MKKTRKIIRKVVDFLIRKIIPMDLLNNLYHDSIIRASASTYSPQELSRLGLEITLNLSNQKNRYVGDVTNHVYPEIVIWRRDYPMADTGQAVIVEAIETATTLAMPPINKWRVLSGLGIRFNLIVPNANLRQVKDLLATYQLPLANIVLQTYTQDAQNRFVFTKI